MTTAFVTLTDMFYLKIKERPDVRITIDGPYEEAYNTAQGLHKLKGYTILVVDEQRRVRIQFKKRAA